MLLGLPNYQLKRKWLNRSCQGPTQRLKTTFPLNLPNQMNGIFNISVIPQQAHFRKWTFSCKCYSLFSEVVPFKPSVNKYLLRTNYVPCVCRLWECNHNKIPVSPSFVVFTPARKESSKRLSSGRERWGKK